MREYTKKSENQSRTLDSNPQASRQAPLRVILQHYKNNTAQLETLDKEDELLQGESDNPLQYMDLEKKESQFFLAKTAQQAELEKDEPLQVDVENKTGLPDDLKAGIENLSGYSMGDVRVHYNSDKPIQLQALAYARGTDIHIAPGQEK